MGTSTSDYGQGERDMDHPHAYGDKIDVHYFINVDIGSSPRVWGQDVQISPKQAEYRIIPTRMGTSFRDSEGDGFCEDHPHAYGDKPDITILLSDYQGSSPRVWGQVPDS